MICRLNPDRHKAQIRMTQPFARRVGEIDDSSLAHQIRRWAAVGDGDEDAAR
jgi:hypothetical protein